MERGHDMKTQGLKTFLAAVQGARCHRCGILPRMAVMLVVVFGAGAAFGADLPAGYRQINYIVAPRGSYIDTGYKPNQDTRVAMDVTVQGAREYWFGAWNIDWDNGAYALGNDNGEVYCGYGSGRTSCGGIKVDDKGLPNGRVTVALEKGVVYTDGAIWSEAHRSDETFSLNYPLYLFAQNRKGTAAPGDGQGDIICHGCTISEGSVVKRDFEPCVRVSDWAVGFYDLAASDPGEAFYANAGKGAFDAPDGVFCTVTVGAFANMTGAYTFGDGSKTNAISGSSFEVLKGTVNVTVIFTAKRNYAIEGSPVIQLEGTVTDDIVFGDGNDYAVPTAVCALGNISYLDWDDVNGMMTNATKLATDYELVTSETRSFEDGKWYVVADNVVIDNGSNIKVNGSAHLILCDNAFLTITIGKGFYNPAAIDVSTGNALTIYGQQDGSGSLTANCGGYYCAGIGGNNPDYLWGYGNCGSITINGGTVTATGGEWGAGIGGGNGEQEYSGGGGGGVITINGGTVTATGNHGAGIGGGHGGYGGTVTINGGEVTATSLAGGAGIGGGLGATGGMVMINGGEVTATSLGGGAGIGGGEGRADGTVIKGEKVIIVEGSFGHGSSYVRTSNIDNYSTVTVGAFEKMTAAYTFGDGSKTNAISGISFVVEKGTENVEVIFTAKHNYMIEGDPVVRLEGAVTDDTVFGDGNDYAVPTTVCIFGDISYLDWDDVNGKMTNATKLATDYELVTSETRLFEDGKWYVVADNVVIDNGSNIKVNGSAHLILCDNAFLTIRNVGGSQAAIDVSADNALTIYGQQDNSGLLTATGDYRGSGIGSGRAGNGGTVTINGGTVSATGGYRGAGIGGGSESSGGAVTINGGAVSATGGYRGAGIGGGDEGAGGTVTINGGTVKAEGGDERAGLDGTVEFGKDFAGGVLAGADAASVVYMTTLAYQTDHSAKYAMMPKHLLKIPVAGAYYSYVVSNETAGAELKGVLADGTNTYMVTRGCAVKVYFTPDEDYGWDGEFDNPKDLGQINSNMTIDASEMPEARIIKGREGNPWTVGDGVTAYIKRGTLVITGTGAMNDFASAAEVPWVPVTVTAVTIGEGVTALGRHALDGMSDTVMISGAPLAIYRKVAPAYAPDPTESSGAISGAEFDKVAIMDGKAYLDVSVYTSDAITNQNWSVATNGVIEVPAPGKQGFFYLMSKPAAPSNRSGRPDTADIQHD